MESIFHPDAPRYGDSASVRSNGMWYQSWQAGYDDIIKSGFPKPMDESVVLAELHSPHVPCFLHGGSGGIPFLVSEQAKGAIEDGGLTGFEFGPVAVAKIATLGKRKRKVSSGDPKVALRESQRDSNPSAQGLRGTRYPGSTVQNIFQP